MHGYKECTTLCYIEKDDAYLLLYRRGKKQDENDGKYIGVGGHIEKGETPEECVYREVLEETGLSLTNYRLRGLLTFVFEQKDEIAYLYTADAFTGTLRDTCEEGELYWVPKNAILDLPIWEGDHIFLRLLQEEEEYFSLKLTYEKDNLTEAKLLNKRGAYLWNREVEAFEIIK